MTESDLLDAKEEIFRDMLAQVRQFLETLETTRPTSEIWQIMFFLQLLQFCTKPNFTMSLFCTTFHFHATGIQCQHSTKFFSQPNPKMSSMYNTVTPAMTSFCLLYQQCMQHDSCSDTGTHCCQFGDFE